MSFHNYDHKKSDARASDDWKFSKRLRRTRRPFVIVFFAIVCFTYWQISRTHSLQPDAHSKRSSHIDSLSGQTRAQHERLHHAKHDSYDHNSNEGGLDKVNAQQVPIADQQGQVLVAVGDAATHNDGVNEAHEVIHVDEVNVKQSKHAEADEEDDDHDRASSKHQPDTNVDSKDSSDYQKAPSRVQAELDPDHQQKPVLSAPDQPVELKIVETESDEHLTLEERADLLPEILHFTFEDAVKDEILEGWEDEWISKANYDPQKHGKLSEPKIDFVYLWANGSEVAFQETKRPYEENSVLNDDEGKWISSHGTNRYRDWDELRYAVRSVEKFASSFRNQIQIVVNSVVGTEAGKQVPTWLNMDSSDTQGVVKVLSQEDYFEEEKHVCLPSFNSLTMENQLFNTPSTTDFMFALSDDMLLGHEHAASDIVSPLFGPVMGFKTNSYNTVNPPTDVDAQRFGEKPFLIYTSWLLNRRFGGRKRKGQSHFGHALSRKVMREAIGSFPGPELDSACKRFRGEPGFQLYSWFVAFHYLIERHREAMLWSLIIIKYDTDGDGYLSWTERQALMKSLEAGMKNEGKATFRKRQYYHVPQLLDRAGLTPPKANHDFTWTSLDGPASLINLDCEQFEVNECLAPGFSISMDGRKGRNPVFNTALIFDRVARQKPQCGDCLIKLMLNQVKKGLEPVLPHPVDQKEDREIIIKALMRYKYTIVEPNALFMMVTDADQVDSTLTQKYVRGDKPKQMPGQLCLNDDVATVDEQELHDVMEAMHEFYNGLFPEKSPYER